MASGTPLAWAHTGWASCDRRAQGPCQKILPSRAGPVNQAIQTEARTCKPRRNRSRAAPSTSRSSPGTSPAWSKKAARRWPPISSRAKRAASTSRTPKSRDVVKTFGKVAEYWFADPQRTLELQSSLGKSYLDLWANAVKRMAGEEVIAGGRARAAATSGLPIPEWTTNQFYDFLKQAYLLTVHWANHLVADAEGSRPAHPAQGRVLSAPDRQRALAVELRADQSRTAARDTEQQRRQSRARHAHAGRGHRGRRRRAEDPAVRR